jgi:hypothetical protein
VRPNLTLYGIVVPSSFFLLVNGLASCVVGWSLFRQTDDASDDRKNKLIILNPKKSLGRRVLILAVVQVTLGLPWVRGTTTVECRDA